MKNWNYLLRTLVYGTFAAVIALAVGVMSFVGLLAGVVPAWQASRVDPALTLRMD